MKKEKKLKVEMVEESKDACKEKAVEEPIPDSPIRARSATPSSSKLKISSTKLVRSPKN